MLVNNDNEHIDELITTYKERLQVLEIQKAKFGQSTPPHILTEIRDIHSEIERLKNQRFPFLGVHVNILNSSTVPIEPVNISSDVSTGNNKNNDRLWAKIGKFSLYIFCASLVILFISASTLDLETSILIVIFFAILTVFSTFLWEIF